MNLETRKSEVDLTALAIGILVLGIVVSIGASMMISFRDNQRTEVATLTTTNETVTQANFASATGDPLANAWAIGVTKVTNSTGAVTLNSANYTTSIDPVSGIMTIKNATENIYGDGWKVTYNYYDTTDPRYSLPQDASLGLAEYGNWFDIIVIVGVAAVVIGLIFLGLNTKSGGNY